MHNAITTESPCTTCCNPVPRCQCCGTCDGTGRVEDIVATTSRWVRCEDCDGEGTRAVEVAS